MPKRKRASLNKEKIKTSDSDYDDSDSLLKHQLILKDIKLDSPASCVDLNNNMYYVHSIVHNMVHQLAVSSINLISRQNKFICVIGEAVYIQKMIFSKKKNMIYLLYDGTPNCVNRILRINGDICEVVLGSGISSSEFITDAVFNPQGDTLFASTYDNIQNKLTITSYDVETLQKRIFREEVLHMDLAGCFPQLLYGKSLISYGLKLNESRDKLHFYFLNSDNVGINYFRSEPDYFGHKECIIDGNNQLIMGPKGCVGFVHDFSKFDCNGKDYTAIWKSRYKDFTTKRGSSFKSLAINPLTGDLIIVMYDPKNNNNNVYLSINTGLKGAFDITNRIRTIIRLTRLLFGKLNNDHLAIIKIIIHIIADSHFYLTRPMVHKIIEYAANRSTLGTEKQDFYSQVIFGQNQAEKLKF